jgi:hypothetical protein
VESATQTTPDGTRARAAAAGAEAPSWIAPNATDYGWNSPDPTTRLAGR